MMDSQQMDIKVNSLLNEISQKALVIAEQNEIIYKLQKENKELKNKTNK